VGGDLDILRLFEEDALPCLRRPELLAVMCGWKTGTFARPARSS
jgi:hypothetical protein